MASALSGCAIHPLPDDVTGLSTYDIVRQIRCEAREAVIDAALDYLQSRNDTATREKGRRFAAERRTVPDSIKKLEPKQFNGEARTMLDFFWGTGIAYNYTLEMTENNNLASELNLLKPITNGAATFGFKAGMDRQRQTSRTFTVTDTFGGLVNKVSDDFCVGFIKREDYIYPIAGKIGINKMVQDFVYLSLYGNLSSPKDNPKGPPTMVDALDFQTIVTGTAAPKVMFAPATKALSLANASITGVAIRKDDHKVVVGFALVTAAKDRIEPIRTAAFDGRGTLFASLLTASGNPAEKAAAAAVDQFLTLRLFSPTIVVGNQ